MIREPERPVADVHLDAVVARRRERLAACAASSGTRSIVYLGGEPAITAAW